MAAGSSAPAPTPKASTAAAPVPLRSPADLSLEELLDPTLVLAPTKRAAPAADTPKAAEKAHVVIELEQAVADSDVGRGTTTSKKDRAAKAPKDAMASGAGEAPSGKRKAKKAKQED
jgi:hypothetical protein